MRTTARLATGLIAAALTLSLGTTGASASDAPTSTTTGVPAVESTPRLLTPGAVPPIQGQRRAGATAQAAPNFTRIHASNGVLFRKGSNSVVVYLNGDFGTAPEGETLEKTTFTLQVDGKNHTGVPLGYDNDENVYFFNTQSGWGAGTAKILNTTFTYSDGSSVMDGTDGNTFYLRNYVESTSYYSYAVTVYDPSDKIRFEPKHWVIFKPGSGTYVSLGEIRLQYKKGNAWKTMKVIKLNSQGSGSYTTYVAGKRSYRLFVPTTSTQAGFATPYSTF